MLKIDLKLLRTLAQLLLISVIGGCSPSFAPEKTNHSTNQVSIEDVRVGNGKPAQKGDTLSIHYVGKLSNGAIFDSTKDRGQPFQFTLGLSEVIPGLDLGLKGMKPGGRRRLIIPPKFGFQKTNRTGVVPASSTLFYEVELLELRSHGSQ